LNCLRGGGRGRRCCVQNHSPLATNLSIPTYGTKSEYQGTALKKFFALNTAAQDRPIMPVHADSCPKMPETVCSYTSSHVAAGPHSNALIRACGCMSVRVHRTVEFRLVGWGRSRPVPPVPKYRNLSENLQISWKMPVSICFSANVSKNIGSDGFVSISIEINPFLSIRISNPRQRSLPQGNKVRWCSGGIRLLAMQETGGQLLAEKQGSRAALVDSSGEVRA